MSRLALRARAAPTSSSLLSWRLLLCVVLVLVTCAAVSTATSERYMRTHSLMPPMLQRYWSNGMRFWAFGRNTLVTDRYVLLTDAMPEAKGYLWNRLHNKADEFTLNVTVRLRDRNSQWLNDGKSGGIGIWYTSTQRVNYLSEATFFGFQPYFVGVGVVLDHGDTITLVQSDNKTAMSINALHEAAAAAATTASPLSCHIPYLSTHPITLSLTYVNKTLSVYYGVYDAVDDDAVNDDNTDNAANDALVGGMPLWLTDEAVAPRVWTFCAQLTSLPLTSSSYHFGVTAANDKKSAAGHMLYRIAMSAMPFAGDNDANDNAEFAHQPPPQLLVHPTVSDEQQQQQQTTTTTAATS